jgi:hypothetical protein
MIIPRIPFRRAAGLLLMLAAVGVCAAQDEIEIRIADKPAAEKKAADKAVAAVKEDKKADKDEEKRRADQQKEARDAARAKAAKAAAAVRQRNVWADEDFEQWVFQNEGNAAGARKRFETLLALQVEEIDRTCHLTDAQRQKIRLMGHGDIKRMFDAYDHAKRTFNRLENDMNRLQDIMPELQPVQQAVQNGPFTEESLLLKSLRHVLTAEQLAKYAAVARERRAYRHRARIELAVGMLEQGLPLRESQRHELIELLIKEVKPSRSTGYYDSYTVLDQINRMPDDKLKGLFTPAEQKYLKQQLMPFRGFVAPNMGANGAVDGEDEIDIWSAPVAGAK